MPTGKDTLNAPGLMIAARKARDRQVRAQAATEALRWRLAENKEFAQRFDELVMREDRKAIVALIRTELALPKDVTVEIANIDADRMIEVHFCCFFWCVHVRIEW